MIGVKRNAINYLLASLCFIFPHVLNASTTQQQIENIANSLNAQGLMQFMRLEAVYDKTIIPLDNKLKFVIRECQDEIHNGLRSELTVNYPFNAGDKVTYEYQLYIPRYFSSDPQGRWFVLTQWHDQPDPALGETWEGFPGRSPLVSLYSAPDSKFGVTYNGDSTILPFHLGMWNTLKFEFLWSEGDEGKLAVHVNGVEFNFSGKNMHNNYQHYLKIGMYRHRDIENKNEILFRNLKITTVE
ncbi:polysaccharide lyase [Vibrio japonicus]|uniref:Polysaccharide lyase n=1 Tax=Vibrio japonicus TaxID=1824638 RepID=A0ABY5LLW4_9VIBR|nr:polysaccharide lyase [Vibrio japonicus]UUM33084.1 polysaccharide lyase [Vibrio japonicus]